MKISKDIKNFKNELMLNFDLNEIYEPAPEQYIKEKWEEVLTWFKTMLEKGKSDLCYQEVYMQIDDLLINDIPPEVIKSIEKALSDYSIKIKNILTELVNKNGEDFFNNFNNLWSSTNNIFNLLRKIMNKYEKLAYGNIQKNNVYEIFLYRLKMVLIDSKTEKNDLNEKNFVKHSINQVLNQISLLREQIISNLDENNKENNKENNNNFINIKMDIEEENNKNSKFYDSTYEYMEKVSLLIRFYCETGIYQDYFNKYFIKHTEEYYSKKTNEYISNNSIHKYITYVEEVLSFENYLILSNLNEITLKPVLSKLNLILLNDNKNKIFTDFYSNNENNTNNKNTQFALNDNYDLMKKIFILFKNIKLEEDVRRKFSNYIIKTCNEIYNKFNKNYKLFYENIELLKENIDHFISDSFLNDEKFKSTSKESLTKGMNQKPSFICDTFSKYIDNVLRETADKMPLNELKKKINEYMILFKYIENKDLFENFFIKKLCIRCLFNLNKSEEAQNYLIEELKNECGPYFVSKSQEMISDVKVSQEMSNTFNSEEKNKTNIPINYFVLSNYTWPIDKLIKGVITNFDTGIYEKKFFEFFHKKNSGKSLFWQLPYCFGEIEMENPNSQTAIKIIGNGVHIAILKCFTKSKTSMTLKDIMNKTKIEKDVIQKYIKKLVTKNLLKLEDNIFTVNFEVNKDGKNNEIALIDYDEEQNSEEDKENEEKTLEERKFVIDAYIMKVLKQKKVMKRNDLINMVKDKMPFEEKDEIINKRIDQLLNNRYISKDDNDNELLKYN